MSGLSDREGPVAEESPAVERASVHARSGDSGSAPVRSVESGPSLVVAGNAAVARRLSGSPGPVGAHVARLARAGNGAVSRALGGGPAAGGAGAAPGGFVERLGSAEPGEPIPDGALENLEASFGTSLGDVRLHVGSRAGGLADDVNAKAFTVGKDIYFGKGQFDPSSAAGYHLLAHEVTHTRQQAAGGVSASSATVSDPADASEREAEAVAARLTSARAAGPVSGEQPHVARDVSATDVIPDFILDGVKSAITAVPGYVLLTYIIGKDPITDQPVRVGNQEFLEKLLTYGPFGASVGQVLQAMDVLGDIYTMVTSGLAEHNLTVARIGQEISSAWDEISITNGIDGNVAIVRRHVDAILTDVGSFVRAMVNRVLEAVRAVVAEVAEPHLETPQIKPVWELAKKVLHYDPLRGTDVSAPTVEILADFLRLIGKDQALAQMQERGTLQQTADWLDTQFATFVGLKNDLLALFRDAWNAIQPENLPNLLNTLPPLAQRAWALVQRVAAFALTVVSKVLELIKNALLGYLSAHASEIPGFRLMTVMIEQNPFTGTPVPRTAENLIGGFIALLPNGEATYQKLAESGVIGQAAGRITAAMTRLGITTEMITTTFLGVWDTLSLEDLVAPIAAFDRVMAKFRDPLSRIVEFVTEVVKVVIELILKLMNFPSDLLGSIIDNATQAIDDIEKDPVAFLMNMLQALKRGFLGFFDGIVTFLVEGLGAWLFRGLGALGITRPPDLSLKSILDLVLQVLGISVEMLWQRLATHMDPERVAQMRGAVDTLTGAWAFIKEVQQEGVVAIWRHVESMLGNLWDTLLGMAKNWIMTEIVDRVVTKIISMLDPTGIMAIINSFIAFFNAIQSAIEYLRDILEIVNQYVTTFAQVAAGNIVPGAEKITRGLADAVPIAIGFLANQVGLGNVPEKVVEIIGGLRELINEALDWLIKQAISLGQSIMSGLGLGGEEAQPTAGQVDPGAVVIDEDFTSDGKPHEVKSEPGTRELMVHSTPIPLSQIPDPTGKIQTLNTEYLALRAAYESGLTSNAAGTPPPTPLATMRQQLDSKVKEIVDHLKTITLPNLSTDPGASAPNIGMIARHGAQATRIRTNSNIPSTEKIWQTESEHVIPFAASATLWAQLGLGSLVRGGREDDNQTTIIIYYEAARVKTPVDLSAIDAAQAEVVKGRREFFDAVEIESDFQQHGGHGSMYGSGPSSDIIERTVVAVMRKLEPLKASAVDRTVTAVETENQAHEGTNSRKNAERRAPAGQEEPKVPGRSDIEAAANRQLADLQQLIAGELDENWRGSI